MGNIRLFAASLFALTTLVACGDDGGATTIVDSGIVDAPPIDNAPPIDQPPPITYDFSCYQNAAPTNIATTVTVSGNAQELDLATQSPIPAAGVTVRACKGDCEGPDDLGAAPVTTANGNFTTPAIATNGAAIDAYGKATKTGSWTTYIYPHAPLSQNLAGAPVLLVTQQLINLLPLATQGAVDQSAGNGIVGIVATDCANPPVGISGATVEVLSGTTAVGDAPFDIGALAGDDLAGTYLIANVPPGVVSVTASYTQNGTTYTFLANDVTVFADSVTEAQIKPGY